MTDTERIDWMERNLATVWNLRHIPGPDPCWKVGAEGYGNSAATTLRAAIDAAAAAVQAGDKRAESCPEGGG